MQLSLKKSFNEWVEVGENEDGSKVEFKLDYPTREQQQKLQSIAFGGEYSGKDIMLKYAQLFIKYTVKDWKNVFLDGKLIDCKIIDNELFGGTQVIFDEFGKPKKEDDLWWALVNYPPRALDIYNIIGEEVEFTEADKKK